MGRKAPGNARGTGQCVRPGRLRVTAHFIDSLQGRGFFLDHDLVVEPVNNTNQESPIDTVQFQAIIVTTTSDDREVLENISRELVMRNLAACIQISGPITSWYRWQGTLETSQEWTCLIKTARSHFAEVEAIVLRQHNYEMPQLVAVDISLANAEYLEWMRSAMNVV